VSPITRDNRDTQYRDNSILPKRGQKGIVDEVYRYTTSIRGFGGSVIVLNAVKIRIAEKRIPTLGDKFCSRHGQKGTVGILLDEEDMPYTASGMRPDIIVNPQAFPSRMTIGQFVETMAATAGTHVGAIADSTPFSTKNRVPELRDLLLKLGYHPYGHQVMYNGQSGDMMDSEIFIGPTFYLRLKLMTEDKINYRARGPRTLLTHQPVEGRANDGGLRIGEMERDSLIAHGMSKFLNESLMERSDKIETLFQPETGHLDSTAEMQGEVIEMPYAMKLLIEELESQHISLRLES
jgi:DNA-directed RNA polymerase II subunit RPB2